MLIVYVMMWIVMMMNVDRLLEDNGQGLYYRLVDIRWMMSIAFVVDYSLETVPRICGVVHSSKDTVRLKDGVASFRNMAIASFVSGFDISRVMVVYSIGKVVAWVSLR